uniref:Uncharacterized protein n=1 Tax=virus sp. ctML55 TaxID=2827627 RepID=A0A8S5RH34_9VIRU|nr:MAG TPA: hypothetical protein [virus sp. ctML55]DAV60042.1 MAG TPA: hypothetical protein [Caudoviricetes sp.]DAW92063.1 MAG TPA: hypothetical protein [Bacteriophage sp.]DAX00429.1 MAG TPA: hypothetical protein [Bacteriophage sp.]
MILLSTRLLLSLYLELTIELKIHISKLLEN